MIGYGDGLNVYQYGYNDPNMFSDPLGLAADGSRLGSDTGISASSGSSGGGSFGGGFAGGGGYFSGLLLGSNDGPAFYNYSSNLAADWAPPSGTVSKNGAFYHIVPPQTTVGNVITAILYYFYEGNLGDNNHPAFVQYVQRKWIAPVVFFGLTLIPGHWEYEKQTRVAKASKYASTLASNGQTVQLYHLRNPLGSVDDVNNRQAWYQAEIQIALTGGYTDIIIEPLVHDTSSTEGRTIWREWKTASTGGDKP